MSDFAARIEDEDEDFLGDAWSTVTGRADIEYPLDPRRWWDAPGILDEEITADGHCKGIECNIWERAKRRRDIIHHFAGGGKENIGFAAIKWQMILHGNVPGMGDYRELAVLPEKTAKFLFEYKGHLFQSLNLPHLPSDRSEINVHGMLDAGHVSARCT
jgi:hypothetical protein